MFEKLKTPAFLRAAREGLEGKPRLSLWKMLFVFLLLHLIAGMLQSVALTPVMAVLLLTNEKYLASFSALTETQDEQLLLDTVESLLSTDAVFVAMLFATVFLAAVAVFYCRIIEKRSFLSMGFRKKRGAGASLLGVIFAALLLLGAVVFARAFGALRFQGATQTDPLWLVLLFFALLVEGVATEIFFRGYLMVSLARGQSLGASVLIGSFLFAYFHRAGEGASLIALLNFFLFGVLLSLYMIRFGSLFGAAALHAAWNVGLGLVCGSPVSGVTPPVSLLSFTWAEDAVLLNGGSFGLEGGIAVTCVLTLGIALLGMVRTKED